MCMYTLFLLYISHFLYLLIHQRISLSLVTYPEMGLPNHMVVLFLVYWGTRQPVYRNYSIYCGLSLYSTLPFLCWGGQKAKTLNFQGFLAAGLQLELKPFRSTQISERQWPSSCWFCSWQVRVEKQRFQRGFLQQWQQWHALELKSPVVATPFLIHQPFRPFCKHPVPCIKSFLAETPRVVSFSCLNIKASLLIQWPHVMGLKPGLFGSFIQVPFKFSYLLFSRFFSTTRSLLTVLEWWGMLA